VKQAIKYIGVGLIGLMIGSAGAASPQERVVTKEVIKEVPKVETREVYRTPESCKTALRIDNEIFVATGEALTTMEFDPLNTKLQAVMDQRGQNHDACVAG
jgi:hypothetical protein